ncbi:hypothetical protein SGCZBJ_08840 [Caulobacter zeae]|uniref:Uncharacterized protein n=1 Tax=Caulobacter zeae TaxID=2055137 RepID=A0A2N5DLC3_9CAUL|nr:hypothetical protein [Caulobacter zeae]PLR26857.1 hypothetical protein SGCZBJ_08840 [Caulobacter zeae]
MARLPLPPSVKHNEQHGWTPCFWDEACDPTIPFRPRLAEIAGRLGGALHLPAWTPDEDFVEGSLIVEGETISIYYEFCLGYLSLAHPAKATMKALRQRLARAADAA